MPPKPIGTRPMTGAEREAKRRARNAAVIERLERSRLETIEALRARVAELEADIAWLKERVKR